MASVQQVQGMAQFNDKEKATIKEAMKEAQNFLANNAKAGQEQVVMVGGVMNNSQHRPLMLTKTHDWKGHFRVNPSERIGEFGTFVHGGATFHGQIPVVAGSKGAVVYGTIDMAYPGLGYLLAWDISDNCNKNNGIIDKVYVEAGDSGKFVKMDWSEIEAKLNASHNTSSYCDNKTGARAASEIMACGNKRAVIGATFDRIMA